MKAKLFYGILGIGLAVLSCSDESLENQEHMEDSNSAGDLSRVTESVLSTTYKGVTITFSNNSSIGTILRPLTGYSSGPQPAYDYSADIITDHTNGVERLFHGGRFKDYLSDGDHIFQRKVAFGGSANIANWQASSSWISPPLYPSAVELPRGLWRQPQHTGADPNNWDAGNTMDPEVIKVGGTWYCYAQTEITGTRRIDQFNETPGAGVWADRIKLYTSTNGEGGWTKYLPQGQDRSVVINLPAADRRKINLHHHEMMYEAGASQPWVMYVAWSLNGANQGHVRMRSATPHTFDWNSRQSCSGFSHLGNKTAYVDVPGGRLYLRITHVGNGAGKRVPTFMFSSNGLDFSYGSSTIELIGHPSLNVYFLGVSTVDGTGHITPSSGVYKLHYGGAASTSATAPAIFNADIWLGKTFMNTSGTLIP